MRARIRLLFVGRAGDSDLARAVERYVERTDRLVPTEVVLVKPEPPGQKPDVKRLLAAEAKRVLHAVDERDLLVACDASGPQLSSEAFAQHLSRWLDTSGRAVVLAVGGAFGLEASVLKRAHAILPLSRLTLPHQLARLVLSEQVYRAVATLSGVSYSK